MKTAELDERIIGMFCSTSTSAQHQELEQLLDECVSRISSNSGKTDRTPSMTLI